jgi:hypothetical protein
MTYVKPEVDYAPYIDWRSLNAVHRTAARDLADLMGYVEEVAVLRDAPELDREAVQIVRDLACRLDLEMP